MNAITPPRPRCGRLLAWLGAGACGTVIADARRHRARVRDLRRVWVLALTRVFVHHTHGPAGALQLDTQPPLPDRRGR